MQSMATAADLAQVDKNEKSTFKGDFSGYASSYDHIYLSRDALREYIHDSLSAGGIGLLVGLLTTAGAHSVVALVLYIGATLMFLVCLGAVVWVLGRNAGYLERVIKGNDDPDRVLRRLDRAAGFTFVMGAALTFALGAWVGFQGLGTLAGGNMARKDSAKVTVQTVVGTDKKSYNGASALRPNPQQQGPGGGSSSGSGGGQSGSTSEPQKRQ